MYGNSIQFVQGRLAILAMYQWVDKGYTLQVAYYFHDHDTLVDRERRIYLMEAYGRRILGCLVTFSEAEAVSSRLAEHLGLYKVHAIWRPNYCHISHCFHQPWPVCPSSP